jgi:TPR repeat protein
LVLLPSIHSSQLIRSKQLVHSKQLRRFWKMSVPGVQEFRNQNYVKALPLLTASAQNGDAEAQCLLGNIYQLGLGDIAIDEAAAIQWYHRAANQGYSVATNNLAGMLWPVSREAATALRQLASQQGLGHKSAIPVPALSA